jgi:hypothetical protein
MDVLIRLAKYYCPDNVVLDGRKKEQYLSNYVSEFEGEENNSREYILRKTLKKNQVKLDVPSEGVRFELQESEEKYRVAFLSQNAISLTDDVQIVLRFNGNSEEIHKTFDFMHATNYFTFEEGLVTNKTALECILAKELKYQGSLYPLTSIIRIKKFINRGWSINAGEMLKIMFQISELDLTNIEILEEQLIGVDVAYFSLLIEILRGVPEDKMTAAYISEIIDRVFNDYFDNFEESENE